MRTRLVVLLTLALVLSLLAVPSVGASPADHYTGPYFGEDNFPPGCIRDMGVSDCYHMRTGLNALDSPQIDVLLVVPVSPAVERDTRIQMQAIEMWAGGIEYLADEMGLDWLAEGVEFRIVVNHVDLLTGTGSVDFSTYPLWDPEIIVISSNPVGGIGIGIDPLDFSSQILEIFGIDGAGEAPCHGIQNPFDLDEWQSLPGFDDHHGENTGTYREDCDGAGGNICFAVNGAIDPTPGMDVDYSNPLVNLPFGLFNLVAHEVGHCLTLGHVGDALDHTSNLVPTFDIMAYSDDPVGQTKCVSTLDVEVFATRMSLFLDTNGDGVVDEDDLLVVNDQIGNGGSPFHIQHPLDHVYASSTGSPWDCPQPDLGLTPGEPTNWTPEPDRATPVLTITAPEDGTQTTDGTVTVAGTVERVHQTDDTGDGTSPDTASSTTGLIGTLLRFASSLGIISTLGVADDDGTVTFEHPDGNTFLVADSTFGTHDATNHFFTLEVEEPSEVAFALRWTDDLGANDLDLFITGAANGSGTSATPDEDVFLSDVTGTLDIRVDPWMVTDPLGTTYTLTATITPVGQGGGGGDDPDEDGDVPATEQVSVYVDDDLVASQDVRTRRGPDTFEFAVTLEPGTHVLRVEWDDRGTVIASETLTITVEDGPGGGKGQGKGRDKCKPKPQC